MAKLLKNAPLDVKLEICIEALTSITQQLVINQRRETELLDRFEQILNRFQTEALAQSIRREIDRRDKMDLTKKKGEHVWKHRPDRFR